MQTHAQPRPVVVLDPGHGGHEPAGTSTPNRSVSHNGVMEKDVVLRVAQAARSLLADDAVVVLTRSADHNLSFDDRIDVARRHGADVLVSLHCDRSDDPNADNTRSFVHEGGSAEAARLADAMTATISRSLGTAPQPTTRAPLAMLDGTKHLQRTSACVVELAHLTNPARSAWLNQELGVAQTASAVADGVRSYLRSAPPDTTLASAATAADLNGGATVIAEIIRRHPEEGMGGPFGDRGTDVHNIVIPDGLRFAGWRIETLESSVGAGRSVEAPDTGVTGAQRISVNWWHLSFGSIGYKLTALANETGVAIPRRIDLDGPGWAEQARDAIDQDEPVAMSVTGWKAKALKPLLEKGGNETGGRAEQQAVATAVVIAVLVAACVALGLVILAAIAHSAMDKNYTMDGVKFDTDIDKSGKVANKLGFNLKPPPLPLPTE